MEIRWIKQWRHILLLLSILTIAAILSASLFHQKNKPLPVNVFAQTASQFHVEASLNGALSISANGTSNSRSIAPEIPVTFITAPPPNVPESAANQKVYYHDKVAVLTYHHIDPTESPYTISPERFQAHLQVLKDNGFHVISVEKFISFLQKKERVPPNAVVITFDDGYESTYKYAFPILKSQGMTSTFFLIVSYIDDGTIRQPPILTWREIMEMHNAGFSFYSHTYNSHASVIDSKGKEFSPLVTKILNKSTGLLESDEEYQSRITDDLIKADNILHSKLGNQLNLLCLPHGQYNQTVIKIAKQAGISYVFSGEVGLNTVKTKIIKRINAGSPYVTQKFLMKQLTSMK